MSIQEGVVKEFWRLFNLSEYDQASELMHPDAVVRWCNTRELFSHKENFVLANKKYPGHKWRISIEKLLSSGNTVISVIKAECDDPAASFYATSFFSFSDGLIREITEYWGENGEPPSWRTEENLSERY